MSEIFYVNFGILANAFSHMESNLRKLISGIAFKDESAIAAAFLDRSQLSENISILKKLSREFYFDNISEFDEILEILKEVRIKRNLFIHGLWTPSNFGEPNGTATVSDFQSSYEVKGNTQFWRSSISRKFSIEDFEVLLEQVNKASNKIIRLAEILEEYDDYEFSFRPFLPSKYIIRRIISDVDEG